MSLPMSGLGWVETMRLLMGYKGSQILTIHLLLELLLSSGRTTTEIFGYLEDSLELFSMVKTATTCGSTSCHPTNGCGSLATILADTVESMAPKGRQIHRMFLGRENLAPLGTIKTPMWPTYLEEVDTILLELIVTEILLFFIIYHRQFE